MAEEIAIPNAQSTVKVRNPLAVALLGLITIGIYWIFWWYFINREMVDYGQANDVPDLGDNPWLSVLAVTLGALVIIHALGSNNFSPVLTFILALFPILQLIAWFLMQSNLNQSWERMRG